MVDCRLAQNAEEAERVQAVFRRYLQLGSVKALEREGIPAKRWTNRAGAEAGGGLMNRGALYYLLRNPAYRGSTRHKDKLYPDTHPAIIEQGLWEQVQAKLEEGSAERSQKRLRGEPAQLERKVFDDRNNPMVAVHTKRGVKRYRYYVSRAKLTGEGKPGSLPRVSAGLLEHFLSEQLRPLLAPAWLPAGEGAQRVGSALEAVTVSEDQIVARVVEAALRPDALNAADGRRDEDGICSLRLPFHMRRRRGEVVLSQPSAPEVSPRIDRALVRAVVLAKTWSRELEQGGVASIKALARREGLCNHYTSRLLPLAYLAPDITEAILAGRQPRSLSLAP
jgi:site-specific DNA recombinase